MKILVIDDDPAMTELLRLLLRPTKSTVITANSGCKGIDLVKTENPDIIILDIMIPEIDGCHVCQTVRKFSDLPILILSALDRPGMVAQALDSGADDYLIKPVPGKELIAHINNLIRRAHAQNGALMSNHTAIDVK
jgi:two-component system, OmpR family, response regulator MprA